LIFAAAVSLAASASADSPHTVDPALMTPTLNPEYSPWTCLIAGTGITCTGYQDLSYTNEPLDLQCGGRTVYVTGVQRSKFVRWHDLDGRAVKTSIQTNFPSDQLTHHHHRDVQRVSPAPAVGEVEQRPADHHGAELCGPPSPVLDARRRQVHGEILRRGGDLDLAVLEPVEEPARWCCPAWR
jgi:hypothetical protein